MALEALQCRCHLLSPPSNPKPRTTSTTQILTHYQTLKRTFHDTANRCHQNGIRFTSMVFYGHAKGWRKQSNARKRTPKGKWERERFFPIQEVHRGDPEERKSHMNVPPGRAVLDLSGAEPAAVLAQACEKRGPKARCDRKVEAVEEKYPYRKFGEQLTTSFIKLQVLGAPSGQHVHYTPSTTDGSTPPLVGKDHLLPWGSSVHLCPGDRRSRNEKSGQS